MKNNIIIAVLSTIVAVFVILLIIGLATPDEKTISVPIDNKPELMGQFKDEFMGGCTEDDTTSYAFCSCSYDSMLNMLGESGMIDMSIDYLKTEQIPEKVINQVISDCSSEM